MASSAMITVPTTASRFALLHIDSDSDSDGSDPGKTTTKTGRDSSGKTNRQGKTAGGKGQGNDKKKDKKKKRKEQQQSEANEVRHPGPVYFLLLSFTSPEMKRSINSAQNVTLHCNYVYLYTIFTRTSFFKYSQTSVLPTKLHFSKLYCLLYKRLR